MQAVQDEIIDLNRACQIIGISVGYAYQIYHTWPNYGVRILKHQPNARPRFYTEDIYRMMESRK